MNATRQSEIIALERAIEKTIEKQKRVDRDLDRLHMKLCAQQSELRFQKLMDRMDKKEVEA